MKIKFSMFLLSLGLAAATLLPAQAQDAKVGDRAAGEKKAQQCIGCHGIPGYQASFPEVHRVPMISGQNAAYIESALTAYRKGERKHPTMHGVASALSDQDIADLGAFYSTHGLDENNKAPDVQTVEPSPLVADLLKKGNCTACHGANFSKPIAPNYPKLAGQHPDYLYVALKEYQTDKNPQVGRGNAIMGAQARNFNHTELKELSQYLGSLKGDLKTVPQSRFRWLSSQ